MQLKKQQQKNKNQKKTVFEQISRQARKNM